MAKDLNEIIKAAAVVRDETDALENTAARVGGVITDLAQFVGAAALVDGTTVSVTPSSVTLRFKFFNGDGQPYYKEVSLPVCTPTSAGVMTASDKGKLNSFPSSWNAALAQSPGQGSGVAISQKAVTDLLHGVFTGMSAYEHAFVKIPDFTGNTLDAILANLNNWLNGISFTSRQYRGRCKIACQGRNGEVYNYVISEKAASESGVQVIKGLFDISSDARKIVFNDIARRYRIFFRLKQSGSWSNWTAFAPELQEDVTGNNRNFIWSSGNLTNNTGRNTTVITAGSDFVSSGKNLLLRLQVWNPKNKAGQYVSRTVPLATTARAGLLSAEDKAKVNTIGSKYGHIESEWQSYGTTSNPWGILLKFFDRRGGTMLGSYRIPVADGNVNHSGLMTGAEKNLLASLSGLPFAAEVDGQKLFKLTASSSDADIKAALGSGFPLAHTSTGAWTCPILDNCYLKGFPLRDKTSGALVQVEWASDAWVLHSTCMRASIYGAMQTRSVAVSLDTATGLWSCKVAGYTGYLYPATASRDGLMAKADKAKLDDMHGLTAMQQKWLAEKVAADYASRITVQASVSPEGVQDRSRDTSYTVTIKTFLDGKAIDADSLPRKNASQPGGSGFRRTAEGTYVCTGIKQIAGISAQGLAYVAAGKEITVDTPRYYPIMTLATNRESIDIGDSVMAGAVLQAPKESATGRYSFTSQEAFYMFIIVPEGLTASGVATIEAGSTTQNPGQAFVKLEEQTAAVYLNKTDYTGQVKCKVYRIGSQQSPGSEVQVSFA